MKITIEDHYEDYKDQAAAGLVFDCLLSSPF